MELTSVEKFKIQELKNDPVFMGVLVKLNDHYGRIPIFSPQSEADPGSQYERFVFSSGVLRGVQLSIQLLGYTDDRDSRD